MSIFPIITKEKQELYEKIYSKHTDLKNDIPEICGYYGRACRHMDDNADSMLCNGCTLSVFVSTVEAILERIKEKEAIGIESLYDSDIRDIQEELKEKVIKVEISYVEHILEYLVED